MIIQDIIYNSFLLLADVIIYVLFFKNAEKKPHLKIVRGSVVFGLLSVLLSFAIAPDNFGVLRLFSWAVFVHVPLLLLSIFFSKTLPYFIRLVSALKFLAIVIIGYYAFFVEPHQLEINHFEIKSNKVSQELKIAIVADVQTDETGKFEKMVLEKTLALKPDLILLAGDYIQEENKEKRELQYKKLNALLKELDFSAPLGTYAVRGNVEHNDWPLIFENTGVYCFNQTQILRLNTIEITGLSLFDSFNSGLPTPSQPSADSVFSIMFGHAPDFALSSPHADLLIAGHTHGGQVQLPFFGPIFTLSNVPRNWANGLTEINPNTMLIVSRGIGMERSNAPRLRFLCKPEIVIVTIIPE